MSHPVLYGFAAILVAGFCGSCVNHEPPLPPVKLPRGGKVQYNGTYGFWDRNSDGKPDRIRHYWGSGYAREYFDDDFDGKWDGAEHAGGGKLATGLKEKRIPEGLVEQDHTSIARALEHCVPE